MKHAMKHIILALLVLCMVLPLVSCAADTPDYSSYSYGNMQVQDWLGDYMLYNGKVVFLARYQEETDHSRPWPPRSYLCQYDPATGAVSSFCQEPGCTHTAEECNSRYMNMLETYQGALYGIKQMGLDDSRGVYRFEDGKFVRVAEDTLETFFHGGDTLYTIRMDGNLYGDSGDGPQLVAEHSYPGLRVIFDHTLYGHGIHSAARMDLSAEAPELEWLMPSKNSVVDGQHIYYVGKGFFLYRCNLDGSNPELLVEKPVFPESLNFDKDYVYFRLDSNHEDYPLSIYGSDLDGNNPGSIESDDGYSVYRLSKSRPGQPEEIATLEEQVNRIYTVPDLNLVFVLGDYDIASQWPNTYVMNSDGSNSHKLDFTGVLPPEQ